jgi:uncharacterized protein (DUF2147 family)
MKNYGTTKFVRRSLRTPGIIASILAAVQVTAAVPAAAGPGAEIGLWYDNTGDGAVKIEPCGQNLCGKIVWLKSPLNDQGQPRIDRHNPEAAKQRRPICGLQILGELKPLPEGGFDNGWVYDPKEGKSYSLAIKLSSKDELTITGYLGVKLLGKTFTWTRAKTELPSCAASSAAVPSDQKTGEQKARGTTNVEAGAAAAAATAPSAGKVKKAGTVETLPWGDAKPAVKPAAPKPAAAKAPVAKAPVGGSQLGASGVQPAAKKKIKPPAKVTQQPPATASQ